MNRKKLFFVIMTVLTVVALAFGVSGCGGAKKSITFAVNYEDDKSDVIEIKTDAENLLTALENEKIAVLEETEDGYIIKSVKGVAADAEKKEKWHITKGGEELQGSFSEIIISDGDAFELSFVAGISEKGIAEFFEKNVETDARPIAVMIDNDNSDARPQAGIEEAFLVYEMFVEGGSTRYMALFKNAETKKIGPVRSSRHYFLDYAMENDAIYAHFGWSPLAQQDISALGINNINGLYDSSTFYRDYSVTSDWHTAYTSIESLEKSADAKEYSFTTDKGNVFTYNRTDTDLENGSPAEKVTLKYSGFYITGYKYNPETKLYTKQLGQSDYPTQSGKPIAVKNIIVQFASNYNLGDGSARQQIDTVGSSTGYYITNGKCIEINWSKSSRSAKTVYTDKEGKEIKLNPGTTYVNLINKSIGAVIE